MRACCDGGCIGSHLFRIAFNWSDDNDDKMVESLADDFTGQVLEFD
jgi:hypothetical protein